MTDKFLSSGRGAIAANLTDGSQDIYINSCAIKNLTPSKTLKTNSISQLISSNLDITDISGLQARLDNTISNPYNGTIRTTDIHTDNFDSLNSEINTIVSQIDDIGSDYVSKTLTTVQTLAGDLNIPAPIGNVQVGTELSSTIQKTANITLPPVAGITDFSGEIHVAKIKSASHNTEVEFETDGAMTLTADGNINISSTLTTIGSNLKINQNLVDVDSNILYPLKQGSGVGSYYAGLNTSSGTGNSCISIGANAGHSLMTGNYNLSIGSTAGVALRDKSYNTIIGARCGHLFNSTGCTMIGSYVNERGAAGDSSTFMGYNAGRDITGIRNTCIGQGSGINLTNAWDCTFIGTSAGTQSAASAGFNNQIAIGSGANTNAVNQCVIGNNNLSSFLSNGFRDLDVKTANVLRIGNTNATSIELGNTTILKDTTIMRMKTPTSTDFEALRLTNYNDITLPGAISFYPNIGTKSGVTSNTRAGIAVSSNSTAGLEYKWITIDKWGGGGEFNMRNTRIYSEDQVMVRINNIGMYIGGDVDTTYKLQLSEDSAAKPTTSTWTISSDIQFKEDIQDADLQRCTDDIESIPLVRFKWKDDYIAKHNVSDIHNLGFIAQSVAPVFPKSVHTVIDENDSSHLNLDYHSINMSLIGAVQNLIKKNKELEARIIALETK